MILCKAEYAKDIDRAVFPGIQGGPLMHVIAGKAVCLGEALRARVQAPTPGRSSTTPRRWPRCSPAGGVRLVSGGTDNHLLLADVTPLGLTGAAGRAGPGPLRHHGQQEHDPLRPAEADGPLGHPHGHAGLDHAAAWAARKCGPSAAGSSQVLRARTTRRCCARIRGQVLDLCRQFPVPALTARLKGRRQCACQARS